MFTDQMFTGQPEKKSDIHIVALVELDMQKMRVHIVLSRGAIRERLQEMEYSFATTTGTSRPSPVSKNCEIVNDLLDTEDV
jgi:hypothetical protein